MAVFNQDQEQLAQQLKAQGQADRLSGKSPVWTDEKAYMAGYSSRQQKQSHLADSINIENCVADLENLSYQIQKYLEMREICDDQEKVDRQFDTVLRDLKNTSVIYTDVAAQVIAVAKPIAA